MVRYILILLISLCSALATVLATPSAHAKDDTYKTIVSKTDPVVSEIVFVTIRGEFNDRSSLAKLNPLDLKDFDWIQLIRDKWFPERIDGELFYIFERHLALFPRRAGKLVIPPFVHNISFVSGSQRRDVVYQTQPVTLTVAPYPDTGKPLASNAVTVQDELSTDPGALKDGESLTRRVTLTAHNSMAHMIPPRPELRTPWLISFTAPETRETVLTQDGPVGRVIWEWQLRPKTGEPGVLPPVDIRWFNTVSRQMETTTLKSIPFGYASFYTNQGRKSVSPTWPYLPATLVFMAAMLSATMAMLLGFRPASTQNLRHLALRHLPDPTLKILRKLARDKVDVGTLRAALETHITRAQKFGKPVPERAKQMIDESIFARKDTAFDYDLFLHLLTPAHDDRSTSTKN